VSSRLSRSQGPSNTTSVLRPAQQRHQGLRGTLILRPIFGLPQAVFRNKTQHASRKSHDIEFDYQEQTDTAHNDTASEGSLPKANPPIDSHTQDCIGLIRIDERTHLMVVPMDAPAKAARLALRALVTTGRYYLMGGELVEVAVHDDYWSAYMRTVRKEELASALSAILVPVEIDVGTRVVRQQVSTETLASYIIDYRPFEELPVLAGVINGPAYRKDGSLIIKSGYDKASGLYLLDPQANPEEFEAGWSTNDDGLDWLLRSLVED